jgi:hypothetical protein
MPGLSPPFETEKERHQKSDRFVKQSISAGMTNQLVHLANGRSAGLFVLPATLEHLVALGLHGAFRKKSSALSHSIGESVQHLALMVDLWVRGVLGGCLRTMGGNADR